MGVLPYERACFEGSAGILRHTSEYTEHDQ